MSGAVRCIEKCGPTPWTRLNRSLSIMAIARIWLGLRPISGSPRSGAARQRRDTALSSS